MFLIALFAASAAPLDLTFVSADANATLKVGWGLSPESWAGVQGLGMAGNAAPALQIIGDPGGRNVTQVVALTGSVGSVDLGGSAWPRGVGVSFAVIDGSGMFDAVTLRGQGGPTVNVNALGGREPEPSPVARPSPSPRPSPAPAPAPTQTTTRTTDRTTTTTTRSSSGGGTTTTTARTSVDIGQVDPNAVLNTVTQVAATAQAMAEAQAARDAAAAQPSDPTAPYVPQGPSAQQIALDPNDPRTIACTPIVRSDEIPTCIAHVSRRPVGTSEAGQCARLTSAGLRSECWGFVVEATVSVDALIGACVDVFGAEVQAMRCAKMLVEAETPPAEDIRTCGELFADVEGRMQCARRFQALTWSPREVVPACQEHFGADAVACMHGISGGVDRPIPALIPACAEAFTDLETRTTCLELHRRQAKGDPAGAVQACTGLFDDPKERLACVDRVRRDPMPARIQACASQPAGKARMKCAEGP